MNDCINQCDGCRRGLPIVGGLHVISGQMGRTLPFIACTKSRYLKPVLCDVCGLGHGVLEECCGVKTEASDVTLNPCFSLSYEAEIQRYRLKCEALEVDNARLKDFVNDVIDYNHSEHINQEVIAAMVEKHGIAEAGRDVSGWVIGFNKMDILL